MDSRINERNDLQEIIDKALADMAEEAGHVLEPDEVNLAEPQRRTSLTRGRIRSIRSKGFKVTPHGRTGQRAAVTVMTGHEDAMNRLLASVINNSSVYLARLRDDGYAGGLTAAKDYIRAHMDLVPAKVQDL